MKIESSIPHHKIKEIVGNHYGITISKMEFIPQGMCSWSYHVYSNDGKEYFLKILKSGNVTTYTEASLNVLHDLRDISTIDQLPYPFINNNGSYVTHVDNFSFELFEFLSGETDEQKRFSDEQWYEVGKLLAKIHLQTKNFQDFQNRETFDTEYITKAKQLQQAIELAQNHSFQSNILNLLGPTVKKLGKLIKEFEYLQKKLQLTRNLHNFVLCHSVPTPGNVRANIAGKVLLIDWDNPIFAPPEKDLVCIADNKFAMDGYRSIISNVMLNEDIKRFYSLCWTIDLVLDHVPIDFNLEKDIPQDNVDHLKRNLIEYNLISG